MTKPLVGRSPGVDSQRSKLSAVGQTGILTSVLLTQPFPDGSTLLDPGNSRILQTIEALFEIEMSRRTVGSALFSDSTALEPIREIRRLIS